MAFQIRRATPEDAAGIAAVARSTWAATYQGIIPEEIQNQLLTQWYAEERVAQSTRNPSSASFVAETEPWGIVGFAQGSHRREDDSAELWRFYVLPEHQGKGIGRRLLGASLDVLGSIRPVHLLYVQVEAENQIGRRAYEGLGFAYVREYDHELLGHVSRMVEMCLHLTTLDED